MPIVKVEFVGKQEPLIKQELMDFIAEQICANTSTLAKNIYVYIKEWEPENVRKKNAPVVLIDWTAMPDRTPEAKQKIMTAITDKLAAITGANKDEIVIIFTDIPLKNASLGGVTRHDNRIHDKNQKEQHNGPGNLLSGAVSFPIQGKTSIAQRQSFTAFP